MYAAALASESPLSALFEVGEQVRIGIPLAEWREHCVLRLESYLAAEREPALKARLQAELLQSIETMATIIHEARPRVRSTPASMPPPCLHCYTQSGQASRR